MIIANPIYEVVLKCLMEGVRISKYFFSTIIENEIESLQRQTQEMKKRANNVTLNSIRLDFKATINTNEGPKKVKFIVHKVRNLVDISRFRKYLGTQYLQEEELNNHGTVVYKSLPIITINLMEYSYKNVDFPVVKVGRQYIYKMTIEHSLKQIKKFKIYKKLEDSKRNDS